MRPRTEFTLIDGSALTPQEHFVLKQVAEGEEADLKQEFGGAEEGRRLRARFLEELLFGVLPGIRIHRRRVQIINAVIEESLELSFAEAQFAVGMGSFIFKEKVSFKDACFKKHLSLIGSHFFKEADFHRLKVEGDIFCRKMVFAGPVNYGGATINGEFLAEEAKFNSQADEANFNGMKVGQDAFFDGAEFHGPVDFVGAEIKGQFVAKGAKFLAPNNKASFNHIQVSQDTSFRGCDFHGPVSFVQAGVAGDLYLGPLEKSGRWLATTFRGDVNFHGAEIGGEVLADKARFLGQLSDFEAMKVGRSFHGRGTIFGGVVLFTEMEVKNNFQLDPHIGPLKNKTLFKGAADFSRVAVAGLFNADQVIFNCAVVSSGIKVGLGASLKGTIFSEGLAIEDGELASLEISGLHQFHKDGLLQGEIVLPLAEIVLNRTRIVHRLTLENMEVKRLYARNLEVKGAAELQRLVIKDEADLRDASCHHLQIAETIWPDPRDGHKRVFLDGLAYQSLNTKPEAKSESEESWPEILGWLQQSAFNTQNYGQLDAFFQRGGLRKWADKAFIAGKRRELSELPWWNPARWLIQFFWGVLAGYGRKPGRTFWPALALVLLGWLVFHAAGQPLWNGLTVSLDRFLPGVDLGVARAFQPASPSNYVWAYWHLEKIMGWVLAPIALAAIYTRIK
jgi:uncharacterized protein YjbI with pentapeptide repeats